MVDPQNLNIGINWVSLLWVDIQLRTACGGSGRSLCGVWPANVTEILENMGKCWDLTGENAEQPIFSIFSHLEHQKKPSQRASLGCRQLTLHLACLSSMTPRTLPVVFIYWRIIQVYAWENEQIIQKSP